MSEILIKLFNGFTKVTGWPVQKLILKTKIYYQDPTLQRRKIKGSAIIVSNHTSVYDYAAFLFVFFGRTLRYQMAEVLFEKKLLGLFLKMMGGIRIDRNANNFSFINKSEDILSRGGIVGIFPESRLPLPGEDTPLPFKPGAAYLALSSNAPILPVFTNGAYFKKENTAVIIGTPFYAQDFIKPELSNKENIELISHIMRQKVIELGRLLDEQKQQKKQ